MKVTNCKKNIKLPKQLIEDDMSSKLNFLPASESSDEFFVDDSAEQDMPLDRNRCWLCQCVRIDDGQTDKVDDCEREKMLHLNPELVEPWLCAVCERTMEEEDRKANQLGAISSIPSRLVIDDNLSLSDNSECQCDTCKEYRKTEEKQNQESKELLQLWVDLNVIVKEVYAIDRKNVDAFLQTYVSNLQGLVTRLCMQDAHQLYERLEKQGQEVIIEMKMMLLNRISLDRQTALGGLQFVSMLIQKYQQLCLSCNILATFLSPLVERHLHKFDMTWQLHDRHLFHNIIYTEPVVQKYLLDAIENIKQGLANKSLAANHKEFERILEEHEKFGKDMKLVASEWRKCEKQIESYEEKQAALRFKQKMYKEDWEFFKSQRRLFADMVPKPKNINVSNHDRHSFEEQFRQILDGESKGLLCPNCKKFRCSYDEPSFSHMITCGIISPDVAEESSLLNSINLPHYSHVLPPSYHNIKPPSIPSSSEEGSCDSEEPYIHDRQNNIISLLDTVESLASDEEEEYFHDAQQSHAADCSHQNSNNTMNGSSVDCESSKSTANPYYQTSKFDHILHLRAYPHEKREGDSNKFLHLDRVAAAERMIKDDGRSLRASGEEDDRCKDACTERSDDMVLRQRIKSDSSCLRLRMTDQLHFPKNGKRPDGSMSPVKPSRVPATSSHEKHAPCNRRAASPHPCHQQQNRSLVAESERVKSMGCQSKMHQDASSSTSSSSSGGSCTSSCSAAHQEDGSMLPGGTQPNGRSSSSSRDGKQHCECWHCEFFGHEAPLTRPLSKNYAETRERLLMKLKKKQKENSCLKVSRQNMIPQYLSITSNDLPTSPAEVAPAPTKLRPEVCNKLPAITPNERVLLPTPKIRSENGNKSVAITEVEEIVRFINGSEVKLDGEPAKDRKSKRSKTKNKKNKEPKEGGDCLQYGLMYSQNSPHLDPEQHLIAHHHPIYEAPASSPSTVATKRAFIFMPGREDGDKCHNQKMTDEKMLIMRVPAPDPRVIVVAETAVKADPCVNGVSRCLTKEVNHAALKRPDKSELNAKEAKEKVESKMAEKKTADVVKPSFVNHNGCGQLENAVSLMRLNCSKATELDQQAMEEMRLVTGKGKGSSDEKMKRREVLQDAVVNGDTDCRYEMKSASNNKQADEDSTKPSAPQVQQNIQQSPVSSAKSKKQKKRNKIDSELPFDDIFKSCENEDIDDNDREVEEFKRFCFNTPPSLKREKLRVNLNLKDIFNKKKI